METKYEFEPEEIISDLKLIGETFMRGIVKTGKGKRLYEEMIVSKGYDDIAVELINKGKYAYSHGLRCNVIWSAEYIIVLRQLVRYCMAL